MISTRSILRRCDTRSFLSRVNRINRGITIYQKIDDYICMVKSINIDTIQPYKARIRLEIETEIGLEFNQSEERKPISSLVNFALIDQNPI